MSFSTCPPFSLSPPPAHSFYIGPTVIHIHTQADAFVGPSEPNLNEFQPEDSEFKQEVPIYSYVQSNTVYFSSFSLFLTI